MSLFHGCVSLDVTVKPSKLNETVSHESIHKNADYTLTFVVRNQ